MRGRGDVSDGEIGRESEKRGGEEQGREGKGRRGGLLRGAGGRGARKTSLKLQFSDAKTAADELIRQYFRRASEGVQRIRGWGGGRKGRESVRPPNLRIPVHQQ